VPGNHGQNEDQIWQRGSAPWSAQRHYSNGVEGGKSQKFQQQKMVKRGGVALHQQGPERGTCFTVCGRSTSVDHPRAVRSHLLEVAQLTIAVGWCYVLCGV
jgi:hypothetical protein